MSTKRPPSWWWLAGPALLVVGSVVVFVAMIVWTVGDVGDVAEVDAQVPVDGQPHAVTVGTDGDRMLLGQAGDQPCTIRDDQGATIEQQPILGDLSMSRQGEQYTGLTRFDPGTGRIEVTCPQQLGVASQQVLVTEAVDVGGFVARIFGTILVPMVIGGVGVLWAIVLAVLMVTRRTPPPQQPPTQPPPSGYYPPPPPPPP